MCLGIPGQIVEILNADLQMALVDVAGVKRAVSLACIIDEEHPIESCVGDWVLIHVGFAINRLDTEEAAETLRILEEFVVLEDRLNFVPDRQYPIAPSYGK